VPHISINLDDVEGASFDLIPKGRYSANVDSVAMVDSKKGDKMLYWKLTISDGEHTGRKLFFRCMLEGEGLRFTKPILESFGFTGALEFESDESSGLLLQPDLVGQAVTVTIVHEMYEGEPRHNVRTLESANAQPRQAAMPMQTGGVVQTATPQPATNQTPVRRFR
jgi:hypothetical protein